MQDIFDLLGDKPKELELISTVKQDNITEQISKIFDYQFEGGVREILQVPIFPQDFDIGLIVGSSGSGKSTILKTAFGEEEQIEWEDGKDVWKDDYSIEWCDIVAWQPLPEPWKGADDEL